MGQKDLFEDAQNEPHPNMARVTRYKCSCSIWQSVDEEPKEYCGLHGGDVVDSKIVDINEVKSDYCTFD